MRRGLSSTTCARTGVLDGCHTDRPADAHNTAYLLDGSRPLTTGRVPANSTSAATASQARLPRAPVLTAVSASFRSPFVRPCALLIPHTATWPDRRTTGNPVFLGRADTQIKIRLIAHRSGGRSVATLARPPRGHQRSSWRTRTQKKSGLARLSVRDPEPGARPEPNRAALAHLIERLPCSCADRVVFLGFSFPRRHGKIEGRVCRPPRTPRTDDGTRRVRRVSATERRLAEIWRDGSFGVGELGVTDDFFAVGGKPSEVRSVARGPRVRDEFFSTSSVELRTLCSPTPLSRAGPRCSLGDLVGAE